MSYERFTDRARKVMRLANREAHRFNHEYISTEHILLGLVKEGRGVAAYVLKNLNIDLQKIRRESEKIVQRVGEGPPFFTGRLPHTPRAKKVIDYSVEEARNLNHNYVGTEHLLLGLLREQEGVAAQVLVNLGLKLEDVRQEIMNLLGVNSPEQLDVVEQPHIVLDQPPEPLTEAELEALRARVEDSEEEKKRS
jgi:ATP-dependent Clp protease ATP-binding subunit ClpC